MACFQAPVVRSHSQFTHMVTVPLRVATEENEEEGGEGRDRTGYKRGRKERKLVQ